MYVLGQILILTRSIRPWNNLLFFTGDSLAERSRYLSCADALKVY